MISLLSVTANPAIDRTAVIGSDDLGPGTARAAEVVSRFTDAEVQIEHEAKSLVAPIANATEFTRAIGAIEDAGIELHDVGLRRPTLDDVFLTLTGHHAEQDEKADDGEDEAAEVSA